MVSNIEQQGDRCHQREIVSKKKRERELLHTEYINLDSTILYMVKFSYRKETGDVHSIRVYIHSNMWVFVRVGVDE
jgi:hypothetical protein